MDRVREREIIREVRDLYKKVYVKPVSVYWSPSRGRYVLAFPGSLTRCTQDDFHAKSIVWAKFEELRKIRNGEIDESFED